MPELVTDDSQRRRFVRVAAASFESLGVAPETWESVYPFVDAVAASGIITVVASRDGKALAAAVGYLDAQVCEIIHVGTVPTARGRGLGAIVTSAVMTEARARGAILATLQSTAMGEPVYRRLGFTEIDRYRLYLRPVPS